MDPDELLEQFKNLAVWRKGVMIMSGIMLAAMIGMIVFGIIAVEIRTLLIVTGVIFGLCGIGLYIVIHILFNKTKNVFREYFKASHMTESEVRSLLDKHGIKEL